jgi:microtubule-associated protein-like 6
VDDGLFDIDPAEKGEEFVSIKPWMGAIKEPSTYYKDPLNQNKEPRVDLSIDYVYGYRGRDAKNNIRYLKNGNIVYHTAALAIVLDINSNTQKYFNRHDDDILCLDVHSDGIVYTSIYNIYNRELQPDR